MSRPKRIGQRVRILQGMDEFVGKTGTVIENTERDGQATMYRVRLDKPVWIDSLGYEVEDDLWAGYTLRNIKETSLD